MKKIGLYIHIPFCSGKCPYCDFYSLKYTTENVELYAGKLKELILSYRNNDLTADTIYFGGGTPSLLGTRNLSEIMQCIKLAFGNESLETTLEINPESAHLLDFSELKKSGFNRISMGLQSADDRELKSLGRKHSAEDISQTVEEIRTGGITNISLDLMVGIEGQTQETLGKSIDFCSSLGVRHISAYILKIEKGTLYYKNKNTLNLPDDDAVCDMYEFMTDKLKSLGYNQYEISNFANNGFESRHNLKYWNCEEYLGLGPSAHSFIGGRRFYYGRSLKDFYSGITFDDGIGGDVEEYISMRLRLAEGIKYEKFKQHFGYGFPSKYIENAKKLANTPLLLIDNEGIRLTPAGFLCSNSIIVSVIL